MKNVLKFTLKSLMNKKSYTSITFGIAAALFILVAGCFCLLAYLDKSDTEEAENKKNAKKTIETIYIVNETEYPMDGLVAMFATDEDKRTLTVSNDELSTACKKIADSQNEAVLSMKKDKNNEIQATLYLSSKMEERKDEAGKIVDCVQNYFDSGSLLALSNTITPEKIQIVLAPVEVTFEKTGEEAKSEGVSLVKMIVPMLIVMIMYFMIIIYGQTIGKEVSFEKTSKLVDTLLLLVKPYQLIGGKLLALAISGLCQFMMWIVSIVVGMFAGHYLAEMMNPDFQDPIFEMIHTMQKLGGQEAFSVASIILAVLALCVGFSFYCVFAGLVASRISRAEDLGGSMGIFQIMVIAGFFLGYIPMINTRMGVISSIAKWVPFSAAFVLPGEILVGNISSVMGALMLAVLVAFSVVATIITGKLYKNQIFNKKWSLVKVNSTL